MRKNIKQHWLNEFKEGLLNYIQGNWPQAILQLEQVSQSRGGYDGPSETLILFMKEFSGQAPNNWPGYRELTEKWFLIFYQY